MISDFTQASSELRIDVSQIESGHFAPGVFHGVFDARRADWGAPEMRWFMDITKSWHPRVNAVAADGFFKIVIRRQSETAPVWSWAVEWNQSMRVVGFAGDDGNSGASARTGGQG